MAHISSWKLNEVAGQNRADSIDSNPLQDGTGVQVGQGVGPTAIITQAAVFSAITPSCLITAGNVPNNLKLAGLANWTFSFWLRHEENFPNEQHFIGTNNGTDGWLIFTPILSNEISFWIDNGDQTFRGPVASPNAWHFITVKRVSGNIKISVDRGSYSSFAIGSPITDLITSQFLLGATNAASFNGRMADLNFWDEDISDSYLDDLYTRGYYASEPLIAPGGIASTVNFGNPVLDANVALVNPNGIASTEALGSPQINLALLP